jgi:hypothetical protein
MLQKFNFHSITPCFSVICLKNLVLNTMILLLFVFVWDHVSKLNVPV